MAKGLLSKRNVHERGAGGMRMLKHFHFNSRLSCIFRMQPVIKRILKSGLSTWSTLTGKKMQPSGQNLFSYTTSCLASTLKGNVGYMIPADLCRINCLCRLQLYTDVHGHITDLEKGVCITFVMHTSLSRSVICP